MKLSAAAAVFALALALVSSGSGAQDQPLAPADPQPGPQFTPARWVLIAPTLRKSIGVFPTKEACLKKLGATPPEPQPANDSLKTRCVPEGSLGDHKSHGSLPVLIR